MKIEELVKSIDLLQSDIKRRKPTEIDFFWSQHCAIKKKSVANAGDKLRFIKNTVKY